MVNRRTEVVPGEGLVFRYGQLSAWIGPGASSALVAYLIGHARDLGSHPFPAPEIATRVEGVLRGTDPEPATPFLVVGAAPGGLEALLHGPVQLWDAAQWVVLPPGTGWTRWTFAGDGPVVAGPAGSLPPQLMVDSPIDLTTGVVPGGGLALLPVAGVLTASPTTAGAGVGHDSAGQTPGATGGGGLPDSAPAAGALDAGTPDAGTPGVSEPGVSEPGVGEPGVGGPDAGTPGVGTPDYGSGSGDPGRPAMPGGGLSGRPAAATIVVPPPGAPSGASGPAAAEGSVGPAPEGAVGPVPEGTVGAVPQGTVGAVPESSVGPAPESRAPSPPGGLRKLDAAAAPSPTGGFVSVNLREPPTEPRAPLPLATAAVQEPSGGVQVQGIRCSRGHFNHPQALYCIACGIATTHQTHVLVRGARPPLGVIVLDDGSTYSLDSGYMVGSSPEGDDAVMRGEERPLRLPVPEDQVSPVHAEIRLVEWDVQVLDRGSSSGTFVLPPGAQQWQAVAPGSPVVLAPNSHVACGRRVFAFESHLRN